MTGLSSSRATNEIVEQWKRTYDAHTAMDKLLHDHFFTLARACDDVDSLRDVISRCPGDSITFPFLLDYLKQRFPGLSYKDPA